MYCCSFVPEPGQVESTIAAAAAAAADSDAVAAAEAVILAATMAYPPRSAMAAQVVAETAFGMETGVVVAHSMKNTHYSAWAVAADLPLVVDTCSTICLQK